MYRLLPVVLLFFALSALSDTRGGQASEAIEVSTLPERIAESVFSGADSAMPVGREFEIAIEPLRDARGRVVIPRSIAEALEAMRKVLPHWYLSALLRSHGDTECSVLVNDVSYTTAIDNWLWVEWRMGDDGSALRREFDGLGIRTRSIVQQALSNGFCEYLRSGRTSALEVIAGYRSLE